MTDAIREFLDHDPFYPFTLSLTSRTTVRIARASMAKVSESGEVLHVYDENGVETMMISIRHVVTLMPDFPPDVPVVSK